VTPADGRIVGYEAIAHAAGVAIRQSVSVSTAKRYARHGHPRRPRLPVQIYPNGRAYVVREDLEFWARAWLAPRPSGACLPGVRRAAA
jgi:hypothetical protein